MAAGHRDGPLAAPLRETPAVALGPSRSTGWPREHSLRWLRNELRRAGLLEELVLEPLDQSAVEALLGELLPEAPSPTLVRTVHDRTLGSPFFVEELVGIDGCRDEGFVPVTLRDLLLARYERLSDDALYRELKADGEALAEIGRTAGEDDRSGT